MRVADYIQSLEQAGYALNEPQREAVSHLDGPLLVIAGPGSGKTRVITTRVGALLATGVDPSTIMVVTFTRAAAGEMKKRIAELPGVTPEQVRRLSIGTFHGQFYRILRDYGINLRLVENYERRRWVETALRRLGEDIKDDHVESLLADFSQNKNNLLGLADVPKRDRLQRDVWALYEEFKQNANALDYDDMLSETHKLFCTNAQALREMQARVRYLLVDEFQDTNLAQYEVLRLLAEPENNVCVVGDIDQAIYAWRAARPEFLLRFTDHYPRARKVLLASNYRSTPEIIAMANRVVAHNKMRHDITSLSVRQGGAAPLLLTPASERAEAKSVVTMVKKRHESGVPLHDMAVFYRVNLYNHHLVNLLVEEGIPFVVRDKDRSLEDHWVVREALAFLKLAVSPEDMESFAQVARRNLGLSEEGLGDIRKSVGTGRESLWQAATRLITRQTVSNFQGALRAAAKLTPTLALDYYLWDLDFASYLQWYAKKRGLAPDEFITICDDLRAEMLDYKDIPSYLDYVKRLSSVMAGAKGEEGRPGALNLMTLHGAKGLEFYAVWIMGCINGMLPHVRANSAEQVEEERRLFYVGCTRAADRLTILVPKEYRGKKTTASPFVVEGLGSGLTF